MLVQLLGEPYRVLQSQLRARADGEVRGVGGIPHQHDVVVEPVLVADPLEVEPRRPVEVTLIVDQGVAVEVGLEDLLHEGDALVGPELVEAQALPGLRRAFDYAGAGVFVKAVGVDPDPTGSRLLEREGEGVEDLVGAEPDELIGPHVHVRPKLFPVELAHPAVYPIAGNDEVRIPEPAEILNLPLELHVYPEVGRPCGQDVQQLLASYPHEPVPAGATDALPRDEHLDVVPVGEVVGDLLRANRVVLAQILKRLIREHHAPAERHPSRVALNHGDFVVRIAQLHRDARIEPRRPAADACYLHVVPFCPRLSLARFITCFISGLNYLGRKAWIEHGTRASGGTALHGAPGELYGELITVE